MLSTTIFKQTFKANIKLWFIFTMILCVLNAVIISVFDQSTISSMMALIEDTPFGNMLQMTSLLGMLAQTYYAMHAVILPLIYIIMTANSLIALQVDRGSMAYVLSTPIKRSVVVRTQAAYLITSVFSMFLMITVVGLISVQLFHGGIIGEEFTVDVEAISAELDVPATELSENMSRIIDDTEAIRIGAEARGINESVYAAYVNLKMNANAYQAAAEILGLESDAVSEDPSVIKSNADALAAGADVMGMEATEYGNYLDMVIAKNMALASQQAEMQQKMMTGITAAAGILEMEVADLTSDIGKISESSIAFDAAVIASGIPKEMFQQIIDQQLANDALILDEGIDFKTSDYLMLNLGIALLMFAVSGVSFLFSCVFNLSKNSLALGAGLPIAFFIFKLMADVDDSLEVFKYFSLNTLFDTNAIINGEPYATQFIILTLCGVVLYGLGMKIFVEKDLPL